MLTVTEEAEGIVHLFARLMPILEKLPPKYELVFNNDGSNDNTLELLLEKQKVIPEIAIVD
ncbi:glycosyltransferase, partial [Francisella tularensis subsp. holarctica]|nr:glycosyltransferase [Francisella tularensis subsp. holarctica]